MTVIRNISDLNLVELTSEESIYTIGGKQAPTTDTSSGWDLGYVLGWVLSALGKGASSIHG